MGEEKQTITLPRPLKFIRKDGTIMEHETVTFECLENLPNGINPLFCISCGVCGAVFDYYEEPKQFKCDSCGKVELNHYCCPEGHYLCTLHSCHKVDKEARCAE